MRTSKTKSRMSPRGPWCRRAWFVHVSLAVAVIGSMQTPYGVAQINEPAPNAEVDDELRKLEELIKETAQERQQLKQKLKRMSAPTGAAGNRAGGVRSMTRSLAFQLESEKLGFEKRSKALRRKFAELKNRVGNMQDCADPQPSASQRPAHQSAQSNGQLQRTRENRGPRPADNPKPIPNIISDIVRQDLPPTMDEKSMHEPSDASMLDQIKIMSGPIDRLSLANNLFASGNIDLALEVYKHIDPRSLSSLDKSWLAYQIAGCHRLLGSRDKAERGYRVVTRESSNSVLGTQAKWWLENLDRESKLRSRKERIQQSLVALRERFDEQIQSTAP